MIVDKGLVSVEGELTPPTPGGKTSNYVLRGYTQATKEGNGPRIRSRRSQRLVPLFFPVFPFRQSSPCPSPVTDARAKHFFSR
jgi:hypothetical protein